jgi:hypothetical protein
MVVGQIHTFDALQPPTPPREPLACTDLQVSGYGAR